MKRITIVGGGASGTLLAINLLRYLGKERLEINLIEKRESVGRGVAFGTTHDCHLLNVPAAKMGAYADDIEHFHRWLNENGHNYAASDFVPRMLFAEYLNSLLVEARKNAAPNTVLNIYDEEVVDIQFEGDKAEVLLASGETQYSEAVVLAFGNFLPPHPSVPDKAFVTAPKYFQDPWSREVETNIQPDDTVLILGTGLSMADAVLRLQKNGHTAKIFAISTRGLLPAVHKLGFTYPSFFEDIKDTPRITEILRSVRRHAKNAAADGSDWRAVIDSLRPHTQALWLGLPLAEKKYFMQHLSRYWNVARHRMPPEVHSKLQDLQELGQLEILRGRLTAIEPDGDTFWTTYTFDGRESTLESAVIVNCIGSESNFTKLDSQLVRNLLDAGAIRNDELNFGLDAKPDGTLLDAEGKPNERLFTLGTALKGVLWESTAIPEIRTQASVLAARLTDQD